jgi:hypothetical protein
MNNFKFDAIAETYINQILNEMAIRIPTSDNPLNSENKRKLAFIDTQHYPTHKDLGNNIHILKMSDGNNTQYVTVDKTNNEVIHQSTISKNSGDTTGVQMTYETQNNVNRQEDNSKLPKGHATNVIYDHFLNSNVPLKSSDTQQEAGHKLWGRLLDKTLDDGHHAYFYNGRNVTKITQETKEEYHKKYFGNDFDANKKHLLISKTPIDIPKQIVPVKVPFI